MRQEVSDVLSDGRIGPRSDYHVKYIDDDWAILQYRNDPTCNYELFKRVNDGPWIQTYFIDGKYYKFGHHFRRELSNWFFKTLDEAMDAIMPTRVQHFI